MSHAFAKLRRAGKWAAVSSVLATGMIMSAKPAQAESAGTTKPNIVIILGDDLGNADLGYQRDDRSFRSLKCRHNILRRYLVRR